MYILIIFKAGLIAGFTEILGLFQEISENVQKGTEENAIKQTDLDLYSSPFDTLRAHQYDVCTKFIKYSQTKKIKTIFILIELSHL